MRVQRMHRLFLILAAVLLVALPACGDDDDGGSTTTTRRSTTTTERTTSTSGPDGGTSTTDGDGTTAPPATGGKTTVVRSYFLRSEKVGPVARQATGVAVAKGALEGLLQGPTAEEAQLGFGTTIPAGTRLLGVSIKNHVVTVDLSNEFTSGGGSLSMMGRVAQVVFTATQFPTADAVTFKVDGKPLKVLGGEGIILDKPQKRADWEGMAPAILIESPLPFAEASSPLRIKGTANTFEAMFRINVTDGEGLIVYDQPAMATSGTGTRGTFDITATFEIVRPGVGDVIAFENSPKDGSQINVVDVPIRLGS